MLPFDQFESYYTEAELTPDLITHIRHFPVRQTLSRDPTWVLEIATEFMNFAKFIPSLVCTLGTDDALTVCSIIANLSRTLNAPISFLPAIFPKLMRPSSPS